MWWREMRRNPLRINALSIALEHARDVQEIEAAAWRAAFRVVTNRDLTAAHVAPKFASYEQQGTRYNGEHV